MKKNIKTVTAYDGYPLETCIWLPNDENIKKIVLFINSSGPHTYINTFKWNDGNIYHYQEFFAKQFCDNNIAYCSYSTRGVHVTDDFPYLTINEEEYKKYLPSNSLNDIEIIVRYLLAQKEFEDSKIYLFGMSEGTIIAPMFAEKYPDMVGGLLLTGYVNDNMRDVLLWQNNGGSSMVWYRRYFDEDGDNKISKEEYLKDPNNMVATVLQNKSFEQWDINNDGYIDEQDFNITLKDRRESILYAIEKRDDAWLRKNYPVPLTTDWFVEHINNKSNFNILPKINLPIHIFHGVYDQSCNVKGVYDIKEKFEALGKNNLTVHIYKGLEHDVYFPDVVNKNQVSEPIKDLVQTVVSW